MEILLASLIMVMGQLQTAQPDVTMEQIAQASQAYTDEIVAAETPVVKGIYSTASSANGPRLDKLLKLIDDTSLNALVVDVKDDWGYIDWDTGNDKLKAMGTTKVVIQDMPKLMQKLKEHDVYPIARVVVFKDTVLANKYPEYSFVTKSGAVWNNGNSNPESFVNPYMKEVWDYNIEVAKEAAKLGFKEIQFDYVRFAEGFAANESTLTYTKDDRKRIDVIAGFVEEAKKQLSPLGVKISVDIFGYAASVPAAEGIGQDFIKISSHVDVICPMIYPSHYSTGWFGSVVPDAQPYTTIKGAAAATNLKLQPLEEQQLKPIVRPWLQDFTAPWVDGYIVYGKQEIEDQIRGLKDEGIQEFLLWNAGNTYTPGVNYDVTSP
jgi:hypothetical protein